LADPLPERNALNRLGLNAPFDEASFCATSAILVENMRFMRENTFS
jgi:hypothetical protein